MSLRRVVNRLLLLCAFAWVAVSGPAIASEYHGQVTFGGLPVPGTTVTVTATQGGKTVAAITNDQGIYSFPDLADGTWTIAIEMTGFAPVKQDVTVAPNAPSGAFEMKLLSLDQIRAAVKPVKVEVAPVVTASATPATGTSAPAAAKGSAPAPAKGAAANSQVAGATVPDAPTAAAPAPDPNAQQANDGFLINGSVNNAATSQFSMNQAFGNSRNGGRSLYNGGLFLVLDNAALDAKPYSVAGVDQPKPSFNNFVAGITFGGPLKIPHLMPRGPNFYVSYQRTQNSRNSAASALVPTLAQRGGDLSQLTALGQTAYAPATGLSAACLGAPGVTPGKAFAGNVIPTACISSAALKLLSFYPTPNIAGNAQYNYQIPLASSSHQDQFSTQAYRQIGNKNNASGRFLWQRSQSDNPSLFGFLDSSNSMSISSNLNWNHRFTQRVYLNVGYSFSRSRNKAAPYFANRENVEGEANITGVDPDPNYWGPPSLNLTSIVGLSDGNTSNNRNETNSLNAEVTWNRFRHNLRMGGDFRRQEFNYLTQTNPRGSFGFTGSATQVTVGGVATGGSDLADLLLGVPDTSQIAFGNPDKYLRQSVYDAYINDDFRVNPELSVNAGVRWEYGAPITETQGRLVNLDVAPGFTAVAPVLANSPKGALTGQTYPTSLLRPDKIGVAPIVGIAWRPISGSSLLVRAGYGIYHDTSVYQQTALAMAQQSPLSKSLSVNNSACPLTLTNGFNSCASITPNTFAVDPDFRVGYAQAWQLSAQRDLPGSLQMIGTYAGIKGTRGVQEFLPNSYPVGGINPCPSCPSGYYYRTSNGNSTREAGTMQLRRRLRSGFQANLSYTFSKSLDDDYSLGGQGPVTAGTSSAGSPQVVQDWRNPSGQRGLSNFDQRHVLAVQMQYTTGMGLGGKSLLSGWRGALYKEWTVLTNITAGSGTPQTPMYNIAVPGTGFSNIIRADYTGQPIHQTSTPGLFLNPAAFAIPASGFWGNARRNSITGPNQFSLNASMSRAFRLHDRYNLTAQIDATNALNHVAYSSYITTLRNPQFGAAVPNSNGMRSMSVTMRLRF